MAKNTDLSWLYDKLDINKTGRDFIDNILNSPPSRRVGGGTKNVCVRFPSTKMGCVIQAESHTVELPFIWEWEHDPNVIIYLDQPTRIKIRYKSKTGRMIGALHTPDFIVITEEEISIIECKPEETLITLADKQPNRYLKDSERNWRSPPAEEALKKYGIKYRIKSSADINTTLQRNLIFIWDYFSDSNLSMHENAARRINKLLDTAGKASLSELFAYHPDISRDTVYSLIAHQRLISDIENNLLINPDSFYVYASIDDLKTHRILREYTQNPHIPTINYLNIKPGNKLTWNDVTWNIQNVGKDSVYLTNEETQPVKLTNSYLLELIRKQDIRIINGNDEHSAIITEQLTGRTDSTGTKEALRRFDSIAPYLDKSPDDALPPPTRTQRRYLKAWREAETVAGNGMFGLYDKTHRRGNRKKQLPEETYALMEEVRDEYYLKTKRLFKTNAYSILITLGTERSIYIPSQKRFFQFLNSYSKYKTALKREGRRMAYTHEAFHYILDRNTPIHGDRPFEIAHIDHTELDIELICSQTGNNLGKPWLSIMIDAYSRVILAYVLSFDPPSTRSLMLITRYCVKEHGRLPNTLVVDQGREFTSIYFEQLAAMTKMILKLRPAAKGHFGSVCERHFGVTNTQFIYTLYGNTQNTKLLRTMTPETNPKKDAIWTLEELDLSLKAWIFETYPKIPHSSLLATPEDAFNQRLSNTGLREHKFINYDLSFYLLTLPQVKGDTRRTHPVKGIKINYIYYWNNILRHLPRGTKLEVRYDPHDLSKVYAYTDNQWVQCDCAEPRLHQYFSLTGKHVTEELIQRLRYYNTPLRRLPSVLLEFQTNIRNKENLLKKQLRSRANTNVREQFIQPTPTEGKLNTSEIMAAVSKNNKTGGYSPRLLEVTHEND